MRCLVIAVIAVVSCIFCNVERVTKNSKAMEIVKRMWVAPGIVAPSLPDSPLLTKVRAPVIKKDPAGVTC